MTNWKAALAVVLGSSTMVFAQKLKVLNGILDRGEDEGEANGHSVRGVKYQSPLQLLMAKDVFSVESDWAIDNEKNHGGDINVSTQEGLTHQDILDNLKERSEESTEKLLKRLYGKEWGKAIGSTKKANNILGAVSGMIWAHVEAPLFAMDGDGKAAVESAVGAVGALAGGIIGGPVGALIGKAYVPGGGPLCYSGENKDLCACYNHCRDQIFIPKSVTVRGEEKSVDQVTFAVPITVHSKWAQTSFQLEAVDDDGNVVKTYDISFKYPGDSIVYAAEKHYVGVWEDATWPRYQDKRNANMEPFDRMDHQGEEGEHNRPKTGTSGNSIAFWNTWKEVHFVLGGNEPQNKNDGADCDDHDGAQGCKSNVCAWHHPSSWGVGGLGWVKKCGKVKNDEYCLGTGTDSEGVLGGDASCHSKDCAWTYWGGYYYCD